MLMATGLERKNVDTLSKSKENGCLCENECLVVLPFIDLSPCRKKVFDNFGLQSHSKLKL